MGTRYKKQKPYIGTITDRITDLSIATNYYLFNNEIENKIINENISCVDTNIINNYFWITNIETIRDNDFLRKLKVLCEKQIINMIVVDEFHHRRERPK